MEGAHCCNHVVEVMTPSKKGKKMYQMLDRFGPEIFCGCSMLVSRIVPYDVDPRPYVENKKGEKSLNFLVLVSSLSHSKLYAF